MTQKEGKCGPIETWKGGGILQPLKPLPPTYSQKELRVLSSILLSAMGGIPLKEIRGRG